MPDEPNSLKRSSRQWIYLSSIAATMAIIFPVAIIQHVVILKDFTPKVLLAPLAVSMA